MRDAVPALPPLRLRDAFTPVPAADWEAQVLHDLGGQAFETRLLWRTDEGLTVKPFFTRDDLATLPACVPSSSDVRWQIAGAASWSSDAIRADHVNEAGGGPLHELAWAVAEAVDRWAAATAAQPPPARVDVVCAVGSTYFVEIAKLRAMRRLWARAQGAFDVASIRNAAICLHARTARANKSVLDPYANLLRVTTEAMAAVLGGADVVLVEPHGFAPHLAIDVQHLLAHEAQLGSTADPACGSYYIEWLTDALASAAWPIFQAIEAAGGFEAALEAGLLEAHLQAQREARQRDVATRRRPLVGVNTYPDPAAPAPLAVPSPPGDAPPQAPPLRLAQPFEAIRARTGRHAQAGGRLPLVHLLTRGDLAARTARAAFSRNLFGCAGFTISEGDSLVPDADLVVLCGADADCAAMLDDVAPDVTAPIVVAGRPDLLTGAAGGSRVDGFIYAGIDAVEVLSHWQDRLGVAR